MKTNEAERDRKALEIFSRAVEMAGGEVRAGYLEGACGADELLKARVEALLANHAEDNFLQRPAAVLNAGTTAITPITEQVGDRIGRYKLLEKLGEGGFGAVWAAEQKEPVRRRVALKIIKVGMDTRQVVARFEAERQALAMMDHPNIAKVLDAGATDTGRPYFVMELVKGIQITKYCEQEKLDTKGRLNLFIQVCHAIQHAHQKGIIHRDIKPSNILVTLHDGVPVPKVIDFGIAKATQAELTEKTIYTQYSQFIGTPAYMSPEQAEMSGLDIDSRSDIYSLGVLLYQLLTGSPPFDTRELMQSGLDEMRRIIREKEPVRPSTRLTQQHALQKAGSGTRKAQFERDLDWIVMKCLEKDRTRRYDTASGLAMDITRHLHHEPVVARPPSAAYRFQKMVRRNKLAFAAAASVVVALTIGLAAAGVGLVRERAALALAVTARKEAVAAQQKEAVLRERAENEGRETRRRNYAAEMNVAYQALEEGNLGRARDLLERQRPKAGEEDLRAFEWRYLWKLCQGDEEASFADQAGYATAFSADGKLFAYGDTQIIVREAASPSNVVKVLPSGATTLSFSPRGGLLASADETGVKLWNTETWQVDRTLTNALSPGLFSPDGRWLLTGGVEEYQLWNTETWQSHPVGPNETYSHYRLLERNCVAFSPDSRLVVLPAPDSLPMTHILRMVRVATFEEEGKIDIQGPLPTTPPVCSVAFARNGKRLFTGRRRGELQVWDVATRTAITNLAEQLGLITAVLVPPQGTRLATVSVDGTVNIWDAESLQLESKLRGHTAKIMSAAASPDGQTLVSSCPNEATKLWKTTTRQQDPTLEEYNRVLGVGFGGKGNVLAAWGHLSGTNHGIVLWNPESNQRTEFNQPVGQGLEGYKNALVLKQDGSILAVGRADGILELWRSPSETRPASWRAHEEGIRAVAFSPVADAVATASHRGEVFLWEISSGRSLMRFPSTKCPLYCLAFSPDGNTLAGCGLSRTVWLWNVRTGKELRLEHPGGEREGLPWLSFSPDGRLLVTASMLGDARLWEMPSGKQRFVLPGHTRALLYALFSPDGRTVATVNAGENVVQFWHVATGQELTTLSLRIPRFSFGPDGDFIAVGWADGDRSGLQIRRVPALEEIDRSYAKLSNPKNN